MKPDNMFTSLSLEEAVFQAIGAGSACWSNLREAGTFDSTYAKKIGEDLLDYIKDWERRWNQ